jgi:hypothetical protein
LYNTLRKISVPSPNFILDIVFKVGDPGKQHDSPIPLYKVNAGRVNEVMFHWPNSATSV